MARLSFSKAALSREAEALKRYRQYLPALDLKRRQLPAERNKAAARLQDVESLLRQRDELLGAAKKEF